jgi:hypothetical protein
MLCRLVVIGCLAAIDPGLVGAGVFEASIDVSGFTQPEFGAMHLASLQLTIQSEIASDSAAAAITLQIAPAAGKLRANYTIADLTEEQKKATRTKAVGLSLDSELRTQLKEKFVTSLISNGVSVPSDVDASPNALPGVRAFYVGVLPSTPFVMRPGQNGNNQTSFHGYLVDLMDDIQKRAATTCSGDGCNRPFEFYMKDVFTVDSIDGTAYDTAIAKLSTPGALPPYDMLLGSFFATAARADMVSFTPVFQDSSLSVLTFKGAESPKPPGSIQMLVDGTRPFITCVDVLSDAARQRSWLKSPELGLGTNLIPMNCHESAVLPGTPVLPNCFKALKDGTCALLVMDRLKSQHFLAKDSTLAETTSFFDSGEYKMIGATQYMGLPMRPTMAADDKQFFRLAMGYQLEQGFVANRNLQYFPAEEGVLGEASQGSLRHYFVDIIVVPDSPFAYYEVDSDGNEAYSGYIIEMIEAAADFLEFKYKLHLPSDADVPNNRFGTYRQGQRDVEDINVVGDMYWSGYFVTQGRMANSWLTPYGEMGLQFLVQSKKEQQNLQNAMSAVMHPFKPALWALIISTAVFAGLVMWYHESPLSVEGEDIDGAFGRTIPGMLHNLPRTLYVTCGSLTGFICHTPKTGAGRLFGFFYILFCMLLCSAYTANLASIMTIMASKTTTVTLDSLVAANKPICVLQGTAFKAWLANYSPWAGDVNILGCEAEEILPSLRAGVCEGVIGTSMAIDSYLVKEANCDLSKNGEAFWRQNLGVGIKKLDRLIEFRDQLGLWIVKARAESFMSNLHAEYLTPATCTKDGSRRLQDRNGRAGEGQFGEEEEEEEEEDQVQRWLRTAGGGVGPAVRVSDESASKNSANDQLEEMRLGIPHLLGIVLMTVLVGIVSMLLEHFIFAPLKQKNIERSAARSLSVLISRGADNGVIVNMSVLEDAWDKLDMYKDGVVDTRNFKFFFKRLLEMLEHADKSDTQACRRRLIAVQKAVLALDTDHSGNVEMSEFRDYFIKHLQESSAQVPVIILVDAEDDELVLAMKRNERDRRRRMKFGDSTHTFVVHQNGVEETKVSVTQAKKSSVFLRVAEAKAGAPVGFDTDMESFVEEEAAILMQSLVRGRAARQVFEDQDGVAEDIDVMADEIVLRSAKKETRLREGAIEMSIGANPVQMSQLSGALAEHGRCAEETALPHFEPKFGTELGQRARRRGK